MGQRTEAKRTLGIASTWERNREGRRMQLRDLHTRAARVDGQDKTKLERINLGFGRFDEFRPAQPLAEQLTMGGFS